MTNYSTSTAWVQSLEGVLLANESRIQRTLPAGMTSRRLIGLALEAYRSRQDLQECPPDTVLTAVIHAARVGLEPDAGNGHAWLIPRKNKDTNQIECQLQVGYKGHLKLMSNGGQVSGVEVGIVHAGDTFRWSYGLRPELFHVESPAAAAPPAPATHYWALIRRRDGSASFRVLSRTQVEVYRQRSSKPNGPAWRNDYDTMALKAAILRLVAYEQISPSPKVVAPAWNPAPPVPEPEAPRDLAPAPAEPGESSPVAPQLADAPPPSVPLTVGTRGRLMTLAIHLKIRGETQLEIPGGIGMMSVKTVRLDAELQELLGLPGVGEVPVTQITESMGGDLVRALELRLEAAGAH